jgi:metal-responsive CopG/Arc/MetJ family transcriptional regulator
MVRTATTIGFSVPPEVRSEFEDMAREEGRTKSELFREMVRQYRIRHELTVLEELSAYGRKRAEEKGIRTEEDVVRLIHEMRRAGGAGKP